MIKMPKNSEYVRFKNSSFMIYADFESIIVPESNGKQNPDESYRDKHQNHVACIYG